jgi:hypothetical protein
MSPRLPQPISGHVLRREDARRPVLDAFAPPSLDVPALCDRD